MRVFVTGGTGLVGTALSRELAAKGHEVTLLTRSPRGRPGLSRISFLAGDPTQPGAWQKSAAEHDAAVNLAGESIFSRWSAQAKRRIWDSRILTTRNVVDALARRREQGAVLLSASGAGFYGPRGDEEVDETASSGRDFLALLSREWETEAMQALPAAGARVVLCRFGVVLSARGGALKQMLLPFRAGLGSPLGSGRQWFPWIHLQDLAGALAFLLSRQDAEGPFNCVAPEPVRNREFTRALAAALHKPCFLPAIPGPLIRIAAGEFSSVLLTGQRAVPRRLLEAGFGFLFPDIRGALADLLERRGGQTG
ncbi:MAG: TIGR01777 family oxidoreductase [bacterium]